MLATLIIFNLLLSFHIYIYIYIYIYNVKLCINNFFLKNKVKIENEFNRDHIKEVLDRIWDLQKIKHMYQ
jgi:hypothetical protein